MDIKAFKKRFDPVLGRMLRERISKVKRITSDAHIRDVVGYTEKLLMAGGKRVRPYIAYLGYEAMGKKKSVSLETLAGLELFHAFALVHDDIMDNGMERHGLKTTHVKFGDSQAILLGDLLFNWAEDCLVGTEAHAIFSQMIDEVIVGQMLDVDSMSRTKVETRMIEERYRLKTASYTFVRPLQIGIKLAGGSLKMMKFAEEYGMALGTAFQIQDDLFDLILTAKQSGKSPYSDLRDGQHTVFTQFIAERGTAKEKSELKKLWRKKLTEKDRSRVMRLFEESGAFEQGCAMMEFYFEEAEEAIDKAGLKGAKGKPFRDLVGYIRNRNN